ncbi:MAG: hypothetical protein IT330_03050, partial [Anaerolineae bacterium]|nr:hypothetical protein [Anaerolineae bacterium]
SNDGPETLFIFCPQDCLRLALVDEQSQQIAFSPFPLPYERSFPRFPYKFMPGQTLTETHTFNVPSAEQVSGHTYTLWASIFFSRPDPGSLSTLPDGLFLALEAGPLLLKVTLPSTRQLRAELQADRSGWRLRVTDANGQVPAGPFWGLLVADQPGFFSKSAFASQPLRDSPDGTWSGSWRRSGFDAAPIAVRAWVAAPGYTTAVAAYTVPPKTYPTATTIAATPAPLETRGSIVSEPPLNQGFPTLAEARAASKLRIYEPRWLPASMVLEWVYVNVSPEQRYCEPVEPGSSSVKCSPIATFYAFVHQYYRLPDKRQMEIIQRIPPEPCLYPGCRPFSDREAQAVAIGEVTGYLVRQYGWWTLAWETGGSHFTVRAPVESISREDLLALAAAMRP